MEVLQDPDHGGLRQHFWAAFAEGKSEPAQKSAKVGFNPWVQFTHQAMFRYTVLQAGSNTDGSGTLWAAEPYAGGCWETGVLDRMKKTGALIKPVERSIKNTYPSPSWPTAPGTKIADFAWGVATRPTDDRIEHLHILKPPANGSATLKLPPPADGRKFAKAFVLEKSKPVSLKQQTDGLTLTLPDGATWNRVNTVIALQVAADSPRQNAALWKGCRASSHTENSKHPSMATDGKPDTHWASDPQDTTPWLAIDLGSPCAIERMELEGGFRSGDRMIGSQNFDFSQSETLATFQGAAAPALEILKATYGSGASTADLTDKLRQLAATGTLRVTANNVLAGGDPAPNPPKELRVEYKLGGEQATKVVKEEETLTIGQSAPSRIDLGNKPASRHLRVERITAGQPMQVVEWRVSGLLGRCCGSSHADKPNPAGSRQTPRPEGCRSACPSTVGRCGW